jgi:hypothetical protein
MFHCTGVKFNSFALAMINARASSFSFLIVDAFELEENEMASFYMTNDKFELLQEIPLFSIEDKNNSMLAMNEIIISSVFQSEGNQLLYIYDFLNMWRFLITFHASSKNTTDETICINKIGKMPTEAPEIIFEAEKEFDPFEEAFDKFNEHEEY